MYFDAAYIAKVYVNEPDSAAVRKLFDSSPTICSSALALVEVTSVFQRHVREQNLTISQGRWLVKRLRYHVRKTAWNLILITGHLLDDTCRLIHRFPPNALIRAGDAIHLATALSQDETEIWTNDRHLPRAAQHVGPIGRTV